MSLFFYERIRIYKALFVQKTITYIIKTITYIVKSIKDIKAKFYSKANRYKCYKFTLYYNMRQISSYTIIEQIFEDC